MDNKKTGTAGASEMNASTKAVVGKASAKDEATVQTAGTKTAPEGSSSESIATEQASTSGTVAEEATAKTTSEEATGAQTATERTATEAGWHLSRYNLHAKIPDSKMVAIANLFKGNCAEYTPIELYLMSVLDQISENHPIIKRLAKRGVIANFDERAALETMGRGACAMGKHISLTICPTMGCNFDCPYCFENHYPRIMTQEVQDDVMGLIERMLDASGAKSIGVTWFGGEPLLAPQVIEALSKRILALVEERDLEYNASIITNGYLLTAKNIALLEACKVEDAQVTLDGIGAAHNATRHLAGGGDTFDRIVENLRQPMKFHVNIRHNVHAGNRDQMQELEDFVKQLAEETGNDIQYYPAPVAGSEVADERGQQVGLLCGGTDSEVGIKQDAYRFAAGRGQYCGAHHIWSVGIDERGNLQKCWEAVDKPEISFGTAHDWDPTDALATASHPDNLTMYLNTANPVPDDECRECVWLPSCVGGCPHKRLFAQRYCVPYKDDAEAYVLALHRRMIEEKERREAGDDAEEAPAAGDGAADKE